ncbi:hypothetical protein [Reichenbachiella sp.]
MEVTFLQRAFGLRDVDYLKTDYPVGLIQIHVRDKVVKAEMFKLCY